MRTSFSPRMLIAALALTASACTQVPLTPCDPLPPCHARNAILTPAAVWDYPHYAPLPNPRSARHVTITARKAAPKAEESAPFVPPEPVPQVVTVSHEEPAKVDASAAKPPAPAPALAPAPAAQPGCVWGCRCGCTCGYH